MIGRRVEHAHNTPEQIGDYITSALELVEALEVADDLRVAVFTKAVDLFASKSVTVEHVQPAGALLSPPRGL